MIGGSLGCEFKGVSELWPGVKREVGEVVMCWGWYSWVRFGALVLCI